MTLPAAERRTGTDRLADAPSASAGQAPLDVAGQSPGDAGRRGHRALDRWRRHRTGALRLVAALGGGYVLALAFPPTGLWAAALPGVAAVILAVRGTRLRAAYGLGLAAGLTFFLTLFAWVRPTGLDAWVAFAVAEAAIFALAGPALALVTRLPGWPFLAAAVWTAEEAIRGRFPFGGVPFGRLAFSQPGSPFGRLAALGGAPVVTAAVVFAGALLAAAAVALWERHPRQVGLGVLGAGLVLAVGLVVPLAGGGPVVPVALVQGGVPDPHAETVAEAVGVLNGHLEQTYRLAAAVRAGTDPVPAFVVWPEDSVGIDPAHHPHLAAVLRSTAALLGRPMLLGEVVSRAGHLYNEGVVWTAAGPGQRYLKQHLVPFGEYVPFRSVFGRLVPRLDRQIPENFTPGHRPGVLHIAGIPIGDVICFDVGYDTLVRQDVTRGARVIVVQTNDADFAPAETHQQLDMARIQAIAYGRSVLIAATDGESAVITPDGRVVAHLGRGQVGAIDHPVVLRRQRTIADRLRWWPEIVLCGIAGVGCLAGAWVGLRRRHRNRPVVPAENTQEAGT